MKTERLSPKKHSILLENCEVKPARQDEGYIVMLKTSTVIKQPPKMLDVALLMADFATATRHGQTHASVCQRWTTETVFAFGDLMGRPFVRLLVVTTFQLRD